MKNKCVSSLISLLFVTSAAQATPTFTREQIESLTRQTSPSVQAIRSHVDGARAGVDTASAYPNPDVEYQRGSSKPRMPGVTTGDLTSYVVTQPIDLPNRRSARIDTAEAALLSARALSRGLESDLIARVRLRYFEVLRRQAELKAALEDQAQMEGVRDRIALRVETGEAPRFELVKADAEMLNSQKNAYTTELRVSQARSSLRALIGQALPEEFTLSGRLEDLRDFADIERVRHEIHESNPDLQRARAEQLRATRQLDYERAQRWPSLALRASRDNEPELNQTKVGFVVTIPIWDRRKGQIGEAAAHLMRANSELQHQEFALDRGVEVAYEQYQIALAQVTALENGIVRQAENAWRIAEHAYRFGERGILEVLDAQRVFRIARNELISARFEAAAAWTEIERLRASQSYSLSAEGSQEAAAAAARTSEGSYRAPVSPTPGGNSPAPSHLSITPFSAPEPASSLAPPAPPAPSYEREPTPFSLKK